MTEIIRTVPVRDCFACRATGTLVTVGSLTDTINLRYWQTRTCPVCKGEGEVPS